MKIAFLILAHQDPKQFGRLIKALYGKETRFFVHVDKKVAIEPFYKQCKHLENVHFINKRLKIYWGGYNMVKATLLLMREANDYSENFKYFIMLSGVDYPIKSNTYIFDFLNNTDLEYVRYYKIPDYDELQHDNGGLDRIEKYFFQDFFLTNTRGSKSNSINFISRLLNFMLRNIPVKRKYPQGFITYGGWQHMILTHACVTYILEFLQHHKKFLKFHKYTHVPDEIMLQTIIMNSPFREKVVNDNLKYIDYSLKAENYVLTQCHIDSIKRSHALFARKFISHRSEKLIEIIEKNIRNPSHKT